MSQPETCEYPPTNGEYCKNYKDGPNCQFCEEHRKITYKTLISILWQSIESNYDDRLDHMPRSK